MDDFKTRAINLFGDRFEYLDIRWKGNNKYIIFKCKLHGIQERRVYVFLDSKDGCSKCGRDGVGKASGVDGFLIKAREKFGDIYTYDLKGYKNRRSYITIHCKELGSFRMIAGNFLNLKYGLGGSLKDGGRKGGFEEFKNKALERWGDRFTYKEEGFSKDSVVVVCKKHGEFRVRPSNFLRRGVKYGCKECAIEDRSKFRPHCREDSLQEYISKAKEKFKGKYEYEITNYTSMKDTRIKYVCHKHGMIEQNAEVHLRSAHGCFECASERNESIGSQKVRECLEEKGLLFETEKKFDGMVGVNGGDLRVDFYIQQLNLAIEFDGEQHFKMSSLWDTEDTFKDRIENDKIKDKYLEEKGVKLLRVRYNEDVVLKVNDYINRL